MPKWHTIMRKLITIIYILQLLSCAEKISDCEELSSAYWRSTMLGKPNNTKIQGENIAIRKAFQKLKKSETSIKPENGFITLKLHIDKYGNFCNQENFQIDSEYQPTQFNNEELIEKLKEVSSHLAGWTNDTETKTYYLIRFKIQNGKIEEIF